MKSTTAKSLLALTSATIGLTVALAQSAQAGMALPPGFCTANCVVGSATGTKPDPMWLTFDEYGHGSIIVNREPAMPLIGSLGADPSAPAGGGGVPVLIFDLPLQVITGDAIFYEPGVTPNPNNPATWSDMLRFTSDAGPNKGKIDGGVTTAGDTVMIFYSDMDDIPLLPADTGFPANAGTGNVTFGFEVGPEGSNGFDYKPGGLPYPANNEYVGISDGMVPELSTWGMMLLGFAGLSFVGYRKTKAAMALSA